MNATDSSRNPSFSITECSAAGLSGAIRKRTYGATGANDTESRQGLRKDADGSMFVISTSRGVCP